MAPPSTPARELAGSPQSSVLEAAPTRRTRFVPTTPPQTVLGRILSYDLPKLRLSLSRWQTALEKAEPEERDALALEIRNDLLPRLEALAAAADHRSSDDSY